MMTLLLRRLPPAYETLMLRRINLYRRSRIRPFSTGRLESWEEVELNRPKAPTLEGYQRPTKAPNPHNIPRQDFQAFMGGKPNRFSKELKIFLTGWFFLFWFIAINYLTVKLLKPDDFSWVEEERQRLEKAKLKLNKALETKQPEGIAEDFS